MRKIKLYILMALVVTFSGTTLFAAKANPGEAKLMVKIIQTMLNVAKTQVSEFNNLTNKGKIATVINALGTFDFKMDNLPDYGGRPVAYMTLAEAILNGMSKKERKTAFENALTLLSPATGEKFTGLWPLPEDIKKQQQQRNKAIRMANKPKNKNQQRRRNNQQNKNRKNRRIVQKLTDPRAALVDKLLKSSERAISDMGQQTVAPASLF